MRILIFSDTHLTHKFDTELFDYIVKLVKSADQVIINGDFWDAYLTTFDKFVNSEWKKLFKLLKNKNTVYIFGNHDKKKFMDDRYNLFSEIQVNEYVFKSKNKTIYVQHGHLLAPTRDKQLIFSNPDLIRGMYSALIFLRKKSILFDTIFYYLFEKKRNLSQLYILRKYVIHNYGKNKHYVFGHSHIKFSDKKNNFTSCSFAKVAKYSYCFVENGKVRLK